MAKRKVAKKTETTDDLPMQVEWVTVKLPVFKGTIDTLNPVMDRVDCRIASIENREAFKRVQKALYLMRKSDSQQINITHTCNQILASIAEVM
jgi:hypothetical protein